MKVIVLILFVTFILVQACVSDQETYKKSQGNLIEKTEEKTQINKSEEEILNETNIKKVAQAKVGPAKTVKIKMPSEPPVLTKELEQKRKDALDQINVPK